MAHGNPRLRATRSRSTRSRFGKNVWLPWHVFILPGVEIGDDATIGAGSVINRSIPPGVLAAGVPAKVLREASEWPKPIEPDAQWELARSILMAFADYLRANGSNVSAEETTAEHVLRVLYDGRMWELVLRREGDLVPTQVDVVIQLQGRPTVAPTCAWFSLLGKARGGPHALSLRS